MEVQKFFFLLFFFCSLKDSVTGQPVALPSHRHIKYKASNITEAASTHWPLHRVHITYVHYICTLHKYITHVHPRMYISTSPYVH